VTVNCPFITLCHNKHLHFTVKPCFFTTVTLFTDAYTADIAPKLDFKQTARKVHCQQAQLTWVIYSLPLIHLKNLLVMPPKAKSTETSENLILPPPVDLDHIPLADKDHNITELNYEFDFFELHFSLKDIFLDQSDKIGLWDSNFPLYMFPQNFHFPKFTLKFQAHYQPNQRAISSPFGETQFTITPKSINQMLQIQKRNSAIPFSIEALNDLYHKLSFPQRAHIFKIFLTEDAQFPKKNPPYPSSIFSVKEN
jgi:hypothetical protein